MAETTNKEQKRLYLSQSDKIIAGVCGGLGKYFNIDPTIVRIIFVILAFPGGVGIWLYIFLAIIIPQEKKTEKGKLEQISENISESAKSLAGDSDTKDSKISNRDLLGIIIILLGLVILIDQFLPRQWFRWDIFWSLLLILIGAYLIYKKKS